MAYAARYTTAADTGAPGKAQLYNLHVAQFPSPSTPLTRGVPAAAAALV
jgi:hypothetical protein